MGEINLSLEALLGAPRPVANRVIHITITGLRALDGSELNGPIETHFTTTFDPFYSNVMRVRIIAGEFLVDVPDDTINQLVHYHSRLADFLNYVPEAALLNPERYAHWRSRWVTASVIVALLSGTSVNGLLQKRLGDLSVKRDRAAEELFRAQTEELRKLTAILQDGGHYGRGPDYAVKATLHPDTPTLARQFARTDEFSSGIPVANSRAAFQRRSDGKYLRRQKRTYSERY